MSNAWMVRAGEGGEVIDAFSRGFVAIGWQNVGDLSGAKTPDAVRELYLRAFPGEKRGRSSGNIAILFKVRNVIHPGDNVISYDPQNREYLVGTITSEYIFDASEPSAVALGQSLLARA